jgi:hypothetical protein
MCNSTCYFCEAKFTPDDDDKTTYYASDDNEYAAHQECIDNYNDAIADNETMKSLMYWNL